MFFSRRDEIMFRKRISDPCFLGSHYRFVTHYQNYTPVPFLLSNYLIQTSNCEKWNYGIAIQKYLLSICYFLGGSQV